MVGRDIGDTGSDALDRAALKRVVEIAQLQLEENYSNAAGFTTGHVTLLALSSLMSGAALFAALVSLLARF